MPTFQSSPRGGFMDLPWSTRQWPNTPVASCRNQNCWVTLNCSIVSPWAWPLLCTSLLQPLFEEPGSFLQKLEHFGGNFDLGLKNCDQLRAKGAVLVLVYIARHGVQCNQMQPRSFVWILVWMPFSKELSIGFLFFLLRRFGTCCLE